MALYRPTNRPTNHSEQIQRGVLSTRFNGIAMASFAAMFPGVGAPTRQVNIAGRRDVAGASARPGQQGAPIVASPLRKAALRTPKPLRPQSMRLPFAAASDDKENADVHNTRPTSLPVAKGGRVDEAREGHRKRVVISPSQWFSKTQNTPKATRCTIRDSPSHAGAIATLRDNNRVRVLRELHRKIIQSSTQRELPADTSTAPSAPAADGSSSPAYSRDTLYAENERGGGRRKSLTPSRSPSRAAAAMSASPPTPKPFSQRVAEEGEATAKLHPSAEGDPLAQSSSGGWKVVSEDAATSPDAPSAQAPELATLEQPSLQHEADTSVEVTQTQALQAIDAPRGTAAERISRGGVWYMPDATLSTPGRPSPPSSGPAAVHTRARCLTPMAESKDGFKTLEGGSVLDDDYSLFIR
jgi:hypothetical protein